MHKSICQVYGHPGFHNKDDLGPVLFWHYTLFILHLNLLGMLLSFTRTVNRTNRDM